MLVNLEKLRNDIHHEHETIDIKGTARNLRGLKQLMGPVTAVWSDYVLESAKHSNITMEERKALVREMEADIRRAVKKDKSKPVFGVLASFIVFRQMEIADFAKEYARLLSIDLFKLISLVKGKRTPAEQTLFTFMAVYYKAKPEISQIMAKLMPVNRANTFQRLSNRKVGFIMSRLETSKRRFEQILREVGIDDDRQRV